jgi:uncharacterized protein with ParB-like and HNH nuclease domain
VQASPARVIEYFNGEKQNIIPLFQRPYTWGPKDWKVLWDDVIVQYDLADSATHFMGAIVSLPAKSVPVGVSKYLIIDGQQRLSTISVLLCALRDSLDARSSSRVQEVYLTNRFREPEDTLKLVPTQADREAYRNLVLDKPGNAGDCGISQAYWYFRNQLKQATDGDGENVVPERVLSTVEQNLQVVMINLDEVDDPYLIFESLNAKGEPLNQADLVRNYILMRFKHSISAGGEQERIYERYWRPLEMKLGGAMTDFLRTDAMKVGENVRQGGIYAATKARFRDTDVVALETLMAEVLSSGDIYQRVTNPEIEIDGDLRASLHNIEELQIRTSYPLLLRLFESQEKGELSLEDLKGCLSLLEAFAVRRAVCGVPSNSLNKLFLQWCRGFPSSNHRDWLRSAMEAGNGGRRWPTNAEFAREFRSQPQYPRGTTHFILKRIEGTFEHKEPVDLSSTTIEHIMPQAISTEWQTQLGESWRLDHDELLHTFGNLTLTGYNPELGNRVFSEKKIALSNTHIEMNRWVLDQPRWGRTEIEERASILFEKAISLWPGPVLQS